MSEEMAMMSNYDSWKSTPPLDEDYTYWEEELAFRFTSDKQVIADLIDMGVIDSSDDLEPNVDIEELWIESKIARME